MKIFNMNSVVATTNDLTFPVGKTLVVMGYVDGSDIIRFDARSSVTIKVIINNQEYVVIADVGELIPYTIDGIGNITTISAMGQRIRFAII